MSGSYRETYGASRERPVEFWETLARDIVWEKKPEQVLDDSRKPLYRWFTGGRLSTCYNALDRHVDKGNGDRIALIHDSPVTGRVARFTYRELRDEVALFAGSLRRLGVERGDRVLIYMPMVPESIVAMLACARLGAVHSVVFGGFAPRELASRIDHAEPRVILAGSCGIEPARIVPYKPLLDQALTMARHRVEHCVILQREQQRAELIAGRDLDWQDVRSRGAPVDCVAVEATDPLYILYTSGTTGNPKGIVRDCGGHAVALRWSVGAIYDVHPGEVIWAASDIGWAVGHSYTVYGPLLAGVTSVMYEGKPVGTPDPGAYWRVAAQHRVKTLFTAPTAIRAIKKEDPAGRHLAGHDLSGFRALFVAGERCDPATLIWAGELLHVPVIDHWWQTETGWPVAANCLGLGMLPVKPGSPACEVPGYEVQVLGDDNEPVPAGQVGSVALRLPLPPGCLPTLWKDEEGYVRTYLTQHPGYYRTSDAGYKDEDGYLYVMGRLDDVINVAGHRLSTGAMEEVLAAHPDVAECAVIGVADPLKGEVPLGVVVTKAGVTRSDADLAAQLVQRVREEIGPVAAFRKVACVARLPKTRSGKILRGTMKKIAEGETPPIPPTIEDPAVLEEVAAALRGAATS